MKNILLFYRLYLLSFHFANFHIGLLNKKYDFARLTTMSYHLFIAIFLTLRKFSQK